MVQNNSISLVLMFYNMLHILCLFWLVCFCLLVVCSFCSFVQVNIWFSCLIVDVLCLFPFIFPQKLSTGHSAWTQQRWRKRCAGAPKKTCWGRRRATLTSLLHFMTLLPVGTTHSASLKVNNGTANSVNCLEQRICLCCVPVNFFHSPTKDFVTWCAYLFSCTHFPLIIWHWLHW